MSKSFFKRCVEDIALPKDWLDCSWGNDSCPSFYTNGYQIFVDHKDPKEREVGENSSRFNVFLEYEYAIGGWSVSSDDLEEIIEETKISIFERPMEYEKDEYVVQMKRVQDHHKLEERIEDNG